MKMEKKYSSEMLLESPSGFMMPFVSTKDSPVQVSLGYGEQSHPQTGEKFFHGGYDFVAVHVPLFAMATGVVVGLGNNAVHDDFVVCRYGKYDVKYGHISQSHVSYGQPVQAGLPVATSGDFLHFEVMFDGQVIDPGILIDIVYGNIVQLTSMGIDVPPVMMQGQYNPRTPYDAVRNEVLDMMQRYLPSYMNALRDGSYVPSRHYDRLLRDVFDRAAQKGCFFESAPTLGNPMGLGERSYQMVNDAQELLISDFLSYMALKHGAYPQSWDVEQKKTFLSNWGGMVVT